ncbi:phospholipase B-like 1 isoform X1 [Patella vulgata]|uniref:phospholipase B-like 1 isoform X1 n=2 Tax=Patella vulgata TaxID=6465 RepID=UPI00218085D3|nr:phospholipase B-like 1 isoform X1 [Patella vulgata]
MKAVGLLSVVLTLPLCFGGTFQNGSAYCSDKACTYTANQVDMLGATAFGTFNDSLLDVGWGILDIVAGHGQTQALDDDIMFAAGFLEGVFTAARIADHHKNVLDIFFNKPESAVIIPKLMKYFAAQDQWMRKMIKENAKKDPFWTHVGLVTSQFDGLLEGYQAARLTQKSLPDLQMYDFQMMNSNGDLSDLIAIVYPQGIADWRNMTREEAFRYIITGGRCSAMVKVLGAYEDLFMSHSTWFNYGGTSRIYKHWNFNVSNPNTAAKKLSFSSYPGFLESIDDFYMMSSQMVMLQTTNNLFDKTLYKYCTPQSLFAWQRVRVANMMANSGEEWAKALERYNSGTYNNQYMVIDLKQISLGKEIRDNALWVVEQIPSLVASGDQTKILRTGYWPSYNVPFFDDVYEKSGYPDFVAKHGVDASYQLAPRAKIFRRDEGKILDLDSFKNIMRYNDYKDDTYSENNPCNTICCRGDLEATGAGAFGCYDTKVTDFTMALNLQADIVNGPTLGNKLPPFQWTAQFNQSHVGLPNVYNFPFITASPRWTL